MKVLYNATSARVGGGLSYSTAQIGALAAVAEVNVTALASPWNHEDFASSLPTNVELRLAKLPNTPARFVWEQTVLPVLARGHDVLISPGNFGSLWSPVRQVLILQNPNYVGRGRTLTQNARLARRAKIAFSHLSMRQADLVVSISDSLTSEIRSERRLQSVRLVTVKSGAPRDAPSEAPTPAAVAEEVDRLVGLEPYVLSVANDYPHKRLDDLARLPALVVSTGSPVPGRVVFVGDVSPSRRRDLEALSESHTESLHFLGKVSGRSTVMELYRRAVAAIAPSELEAFPLTLHEALSQGTPLVLSDIAPHREIADGLATFFPVGDVGGLLSATDRALAGPRPEPWTDPRSWSDHARELIGHLEALRRA